MTLQIPHRRQSQTVFHYDREHVLKEASRVLHLHLKILFNNHFISSQYWKNKFFNIILTPSFWNLTPSSLFTEITSQQISESNYPEWNKHVFLGVSEMFYFTNES